MITGIIVDGTKVNTLQRASAHGMIKVLIGMPSCMWQWQKSDTFDEYILPLECTEEQYKKIVEVINNEYPGAIVRE